MAVHIVVGTAAVAKGLGLRNYVQVVLFMSQIGKNFKTGGVYLINQKGKREFCEDECRVGDMVIQES